MGLFGGWRFKKSTVPADRQAHDHVWDREMSRLGREEVVRRMAALNDYRSGRTGPSGYELWNQQIEREILRLTYEIADRDDRS